MPSIRIAPSLLAADPVKLAEEIAAVEAGGADLLHVDIMDGRFVPNLSWGPRTVAGVKKVARVPLDVHLMLAEPERFVGPFLDAGADRITVHAEVPGAGRAIEEATRRGAAAGIALNPGTPVEALEPLLGLSDWVLAMTVNPGFGGQAFLPEVVAKLPSIRARLGAARDLAVDGGIDGATAAACARAGASLFIAGSAIFGTGDPAEAVRSLRKAAGGR